VSKKKRKRKELEAALAVGEAADAPAEDEDDSPSKPPGITRAQRVLAVLGFGFCGFLAAFLTGANQNPPVPPELTGLGLASWEGAVLGSRLLNLGEGAVAGLGGVLLGGALGYSLFLSPLAFLFNWLGGGIACYAAYHYTGSFLAAAVGWLLGSTLPLAVGKLLGKG
jgi:hypothetical protein